MLYDIHIYFDDHTHVLDRVDMHLRTVPSSDPFVDAFSLRPSYVLSMRQVYIVLFDIARVMLQLGNNRLKS